MTKIGSDGMEEELKNKIINKLMSKEYSLIYNNETYIKLKDVLKVIKETN